MVCPCLSPWLLLPSDSLLDLFHLNKGIFYQFPCQVFTDNWCRPFYNGVDSCSHCSDHSVAYFVIGFPTVRAASIFLPKCCGSWKEVSSPSGALISSSGCSLGDLPFGPTGWSSCVVPESIERVLVDSDDGLLGLRTGDCQCIRKPRNAPLKLDGLLFIQLSHPTSS